MLLLKRYAPGDACLASHTTCHLWKHACHNVPARWIMLQSCAILMQTILQGTACHGPDIVSSVLQAHAENDAVAAALGSMCALAALECEDTKCKLMESAFPQASLSIVADATVSLSASVELLGALKGLMTHDDLRPPASKAFMHSRVLALDKDAVPVFLGVLQRAVDAPESLHGIISALQQLCANDEICIRVCPLLCC